MRASAALLNKTITNLKTIYSSNIHLTLASSSFKNCSSLSARNASTNAQTDNQKFPHGRPLYATHIPTSSFQRSLLAVGSALATLNNLYRDGKVSLSRKFCFISSSVTIIRILNGSVGSIGIS